MIHPLALIGDCPQHRDYKGEAGIPPVIHPTARIEAFTSVDAGTMRATVIDADVWLMKSIHVGHDTIIGARTEIAPMVSIGGWVEIGEDVRIGQGATLKPRVKVGDGARIGMGAVVIRDVPAGATVVGNPAGVMLESRGLRRKQAELDGSQHPELQDDSWEEYRNAAVGSA